MLFAGRKIDQELLDEVEEILITSDVGVTTTDEIISRLKGRVKSDKIEDATEILGVLKEEIASMLESSPSAAQDRAFTVADETKPHVIMLIGVNGVGKTTTIGKLAHNYKKAGMSVLIGAADTFRAAANEQLEVWAERLDVPLVKGAYKADPSSVCFNAYDSALKNGTDFLICDTAGRLHTRHNLMQELGKIERTLQKKDPGAPDE